MRNSVCIDQLQCIRLFVTGVEKCLVIPIPVLQCSAIKILILVATQTEKRLMASIIVQTVMMLRSLMECIMLK